MHYFAVLPQYLLILIFKSLRLRLKVIIKYNMNQQTPFIVAWHESMILGAIFMFAIGLIIYMIHHIRISAITDYHLKYDYINRREISNYKLVYYCFGVAVAMGINLYEMAEMEKVEFWFYMRLVMAIAGGTIVAYSRNGDSCPVPTLNRAIKCDC